MSYSGYIPESTGSTGSTGSTASALKGAALSVGGGILGGVGEIMANRQRINQQNRLQKHNYQQALQGWRDRNRELASKNTFDVQTRNKEIEIANKFLLPQIRQSARQSYYDIALGQYQADQQDAFIRGEMNRQLLEQQGANTASLGAGNRSGELAAAKMTAGARGRMLAQMSERRLGRGAQGQSQMNNTALQAQQAATNVVAPLQMPLYMRQMTSKPKRGPLAKPNLASDLMIMGSNIAKGFLPLLG